MNRPKSLHRLLVVLLPLILLVFYLTLTNPYKLPLVLIPIPLFLLGFAIFGAVNLSLGALRVAARRSRLVAAIATSIVLLITLLQSIGQLHLRDFLILLFLLAGLAFYLRRVDL